MKISRNVKYGILLGISLVAWGLINHLVRVNSIMALLSSILFFGIYGVVIISYLKSEKIEKLTDSFVSLLVVGLIGIGILSAGYFVNATIISPTYQAEELQSTQKKWGELGYTEAQVQEQVELTDVFQNPMSWMVELFKFNFMVFLTMLTLLSGLWFILNEFGVAPKISRQRE
ncbi:hypothetical protein [Chondrinema litorale]|uniref:hypothetical protein n=1 Tax=Chondrinema litorale TaxID=2994555 RepID=UPI002543D899|nr:hypothetical protein [Chondrinema litorale]UZR99713.1 hypothetical protein OQ292_38125 [Chondrinema litorale]